MRTMGAGWKALWAAACVALAVLCLVQGGRGVVVAVAPVDAQLSILDYTVTPVLRSEVDDLPADHWGRYDPSPRVKGIRALATERPSTEVYSFVRQRVPFFEHPKMPLFVSPHGFLSGTPHPLCMPFCGGEGSGVQPTLAFSPAYPRGGGGDAPLIGLFVDDLSPSSCSNSSGVCGVFVCEKHDGSNATDSGCLGAGEGSATLVEFVNVPRTRTTPTAQNLTAQVEVWSSGTIIFRYAELPGSSNTTTHDRSPVTDDVANVSVGLIWSPTRRTVVVGADSTVVLDGNVSSLHAVAALRFDPVVDACEAKNHSACLSCPRQRDAHGDEGPGDNCGWCVATSMCVSVRRRGSGCTGNDWQATECDGTAVTSLRRYGATPPAANVLLEQYWVHTPVWPNLSAVAGVFPAVQQVQSEAMELSSGDHAAAPVARAQRFYAVDVVRHGPEWEAVPVEMARLLPASTTYPFRVELPFDFPLFYNPPSFNASDARVLRAVYLTRDLFLRVSEAATCAPTGFQCLDGGYAFSILPLLTSNIRESSTEVRILYLNTSRDAGELFCADPGARPPAQRHKHSSSDDDGGANDSSESGSSSQCRCPPAVVIEVTALPRKIYNSVHTTQRRSYQVILNANGGVEIRFGPTDCQSTGNDTACGADEQSLTAFPPPLIGLTRHNISDPSSALVPWELVRSDTTLRFELVPTCEDCGVHGACEMSTRQCVCDAGFSGTRCDLCAVGHYGRYCRLCEGCANGGRCDEGINGTGYCICQPPFSGAQCTVRCDDASLAQCGGNCSLAGGVCECGTCTCRSERGWHGPRCEQWQDPCLRFSLSGCEVCYAQRPGGLHCQFCHDSTCVTDRGEESVDIQQSRFHCWQPMDRRSCHNAVQSVPATDWPSIFFTAIASFSIPFLIAMAALLVFVVREQRQERPLLDECVNGIPAYIPRRCERLVAPYKLIDPHRIHQGERVLGIPLRQISLRRLHRHQSEVHPASGETAAITSSSHTPIQPLPREQFCESSSPANSSGGDDKACVSGRDGALPSCTPRPPALLLRDGELVRCAGNGVSEPPLHGFHPQ